MDGVSAAASIIALIQITGTIISICNDLRSGNNAPKDASKISTELEGLQHVLTQVKALAESSDPRTESIQLLSKPDGVLTQIKDEIEALLPSLEATSTKWKTVKNKVLWPFKEGEVTRRLMSISNAKSTLVLALNLDQAKTILHIDSSVAAIAEDITTIKIDTSKSGAQRILEWLCPLDYGQIHTDLIRERRQGTGDWFFQSTNFAKWIGSTDQHVLYCPGDPGAGKTMIAATIINRLLETMQHDTSRVTYLYCSYTRHQTQTAIHFVSALLRQLGQGLRKLPDAVQKLHEKHQAMGTGPSLQDLQVALQTATATFTKVFVVVDALDEWVESSGSRTHRSALLATLRNLQSLGHVKIMCTSRHILEIDKDFKSDLWLEIATPDEDIRQYVRERIPDLARSVRNNSALQDTIVEDITKAVNGIMLLARLNVDALSTKLSARDIRTMLAQLPTGTNVYAKAYESALARTSAQSDERREIAQKVLSWIVRAQKPLKTNEFQHAIAVEPGDRALDSDSIVDINDVLSSCAGLVVVEQESQTVRLVHYTLQQYLDNEGASAIPDAELRIALSCVTYLSFDEFRQGPCENERQYSQWMKAYPLLPYAASHYGNHLIRCETVASEANRQSLDRAVKEFMRYPQFILVANQVKSRQVEFDTVLPNVRYTNASHKAAEFGLAALMQTLLDTGLDLDQPDDYLRRPLSYAAAKGSVATMKVLLSTTVDINCPNDEGFQGGTALMAASENGHEQVVRLLLEKGASLESSPRYDGTALVAACRGGHESIVRLLIDSGANVDHGGPLEAASSGGHAAIVRLLLQKGAKVDGDEVTTWSPETPLAEACRARRLDIVRILLANGADMTVDNFGPLEIALSSCHDPIKSLLLQSYNSTHGSQPSNGALLLPVFHTALRCSHGDVVSLVLEQVLGPSGSKRSRAEALYEAAGSGDESSVNLLLEKNKVATPELALEQADLDKSMTNASFWGQEAIVRLLLNRGANVNATDDTNETALSHASRKLHLPLVRLLLEHDADVTFKNFHFWGSALKSICVQDALLLNSMKDEVFPIIRLLLEKDTSVEAYGRWEDALKAACNSPSDEIVRVLLEAVPAPGLHQSSLSISLLHATYYNRQRNARLLIKKGANVNLCCGETDLDSSNGTSLHFAAQNGNTKLVRKLLKRGAKVGAFDDRNAYGTILSRAASNGSQASVKVLLKAGAEVNGAIHQEVSPLQAASQAGHADIVQLLLRHGANVYLAWRDGDNALVFASRAGHIVTVQVLLDNGADVNIQNNSSENAFQAAMGASEFAVARLLLKRGAHVAGSVWAKRGCSELHVYAIFNTFQRISQSIAQGADVDEADNHLWTPMHWAAYFGHRKVVRQLLWHGGNRESKDWQGWTPEQVAYFAGHFEVAGLLSPSRYGGQDQLQCVEPGQRLQGHCTSCGHVFIGAEYRKSGAERYFLEFQNRGPRLCFRCVEDVDTLFPNQTFVDIFAKLSGL